MRNKLANLYNALSAPVTLTRDTVAGRVQSLNETVSLLCNRMKEKLTKLIEIHRRKSSRRRS